MAADGKGVSPEQGARSIRRQTRRKFSADEKTRIVLEGLRGEVGIADLYRRESIHPNQYFTRSKELLETGNRHDLNSIYWVSAGFLLTEAGLIPLTPLRPPRCAVILIRFDW